VELCVYREHAPRKVNAVSISPDGAQVASVGGDRTLRIWEAERGHPLELFKRMHELTLVAWSPDGHTLLAAGGGGLFTGWSSASWKTASLPHLPSMGGRAITALAWSPSGEAFALANDFGLIALGKPQGSMVSSFYDGHVEGGFSLATVAVRAIAFSPDEKLLVSGDDKGRVLVWTEREASNRTRGKPQLVYTGHQQAINALAWSPDGKWIASASDEGGVHVWEAASGRLLFIYTGNGPRVPVVYSLAWSPDGKWIASGGFETTVEVWDSSSGKGQFSLQGHTAPVHTVAWSCYGGRLVSAGEDGTVRVWQC
jgi:WD40 repeat protein